MENEDRAGILASGLNNNWLPVKSRIEPHHQHHADNSQALKLRAQLFMEEYNNSFSCAALLHNKPECIKIDQFLLTQSWFVQAHKEGAATQNAEKDPNTSSHLARDRPPSIHATQKQ